MPARRIACDDDILLTDPLVLNEMTISRYGVQERKRPWSGTRQAVVHGQDVVKRCMDGEGFRNARGEIGFCCGTT